MKYFINDQEVEVLEVDYADGMANVIEAYFVDSEVELTEEELSVLTYEYQSDLAQAQYEKMVDYAHDSMDMER